MAVFTEVPEAEASTLLRALKLDPDAPTFMLRAKAREASGNLDGALADYQEAAKRDDKNVAAMTAMASFSSC